MIFWNVFWKWKCKRKIVFEVKETLIQEGFYLLMSLVCWDTCGFNSLNRVMNFAKITEQNSTAEQWC